MSKRKRLVDNNDKNCKAIRNCPFCPNEGNDINIVHLVRGRIDRPERTSGKSVHLMYACENGHQYEVNTLDHSGGTWVTVDQMDDWVEDPSTGIPEFS